MYNFKDSDWSNEYKLSSKQFVCWNCNNQVASDKGYGDPSHSSKRIYLCPHCNAPNIFDHNGKSPLSNLPGKEIKKLPLDVLNIYDEIRKCIQTQSFTAAVMLMRKIIMNMAVVEGADKNQNFSYYIDYLCSQGIVHKKSKNKAQSVRQLGNDANHEIENRTQEDAQNCFEFIELLLIANYEFAD